MELRHLFLHVCDELQQKSTYAESEYDMIRASGLIRQLLLDADPLVHQMNRQYRVGTIRFTVHRPKISGLFDDTVGPPSTHLAPGIDPARNPSTYTVETVKLREFLAVKCAQVHGEDYTIHDMIDYCAHIAGGVHRGVANSARDKHLESLSSRMQLLDVSAVAYFMISVGTVVLAGMRPLIEAAAFPPLPHES